MVFLDVFGCKSGRILFFFQAEDGIRDDLVTGVQTCALPISGVPPLLNFQNFEAALRGSRAAQEDETWYADS